MTQTLSMASDPSQKRWTQWVPWLFLAPALLVFTYFKFIPMLRGLEMSFYRVNLGAPNEWIGLENFETVLSDPNLLAAIQHTLVYAVATISGSAVIALFLAMALQGPARHLHILRTAIFLPAVTSAAVMAEVWRVLYSPTPDGVINSLLSWFGLAQQGFLSNPHQALPALVVMGMWKAIPYDTVIFVAGLAGINSELYDAASVDGAGFWQRFRHVTLPGLAPAIKVIATLGFIRGFRVFTEIYATTGGGPAGSTDVVMTYIYKQGFTELDYGVAAAASFLLFAFTAVATLAFLAWQRRRSL